MLFLLHLAGFQDIAVEPRSEDEAEEPSNADALLDITFDVEDRSLTS